MGSDSRMDSCGKGATHAMVFSVCKLLRMSLSASGCAGLAAAMDYQQGSHS